MIKLELFLVIGKARAGDFAVLWPEQTRITDAAARLAASWLQIHVGNGMRRSAVLWRQDDQVVLACAWQESGVDGAGRPLHRLVAYGLRAPPEAALARLLLWMYRQNFSEDRPPANLSIDPTSLVDDDLPLDETERDYGATALSLLAADVCRAQTIKTAQAIVDAVGFQNIGFAALLPNAISSWPAAGCGVALSRAPWEAPADIVRLVESGLRPGTVDLAGLMRLPKDRARRRALADAALNGVNAALAPFSDDEIEWLFASPRARVGVVAAANADQIASLAAAAKIDGPDLKGLAPEQLRKLPRPTVASALRGMSDAITKFVAAFGRGSDDIAPLLSDRAANIVRTARSPVTTPGPILDVTSDDVDQMEQAGLFDTMSLAWLAALQATHPRGPVEDHFARRLRGFLPEPLVARLLGATAVDCGQSQSLAALNPPVPRADWLAGIALARLVDAGSLCVTDRAWRRWWVEALQMHPDASKHDIASLDAPWSRQTVAWLVASAHDGEISAYAVRARLASFVAARAPLDVNDLTQLLAASGVSRAKELACVINGRKPPGCNVDDGFAADVRSLLDAGILTEDALHQALHDGLPAAALARLSADIKATALLDNDQPAPICPPTSWAPLLTTELRRRIHDPRFWSRWRHGVPTPMLAWMRQRISGMPEETLIEALLLASERSKLLSLDELTAIGGALDPLDLAWQTVEHCKRSETDLSALARLLDNSDMRAELANFLRSEFGGLSPAVAVPQLSAAELFAIHPLLHPVRDTVRQIMTRPVPEPEEDLLLPPTVSAIRRMGPAPAPPPPTAAQATRRPAWVSALSDLPGWERWRHPTS